MNFKGHTFTVDDITKAHICIETEVPKITANHLYNELVAQSDTADLNIKVEPSEIASFIASLAEEIRVRKEHLSKYGKLRVSDVKGMKDEILRRANIVLLLPRSLNNKNLDVICNILAYTVPLDIHFFIVLPNDAVRKITEPIINHSYWSLNLDSNTLQHK